MTSKILRADGTTELASIQTVTYHESVNADTDLRPGCVASSYIEVTCFGAQSDAPAVGEELKYYQTVNGTDTLVGTFYAEPSIPTKNSYSFVAYDAVHKLDADFSAWLSAHQDDFPYTVKQLVEQACTISGVTLGTSSWDHSTMSVNAFYADGITCRNILQYAAEIACKFVRCNTSGEIVFDWYNATVGAVKTASGAVASFDDAANAPLKNLTAQITPVQSGTGAPSPTNIRPISGWTGLEGKRTGKNLLKLRDDVTTITYAGITYTINSDCTITASGTASGNSYFYFMPTASTFWDDAPDGEYILSGCPSGGTLTTYYVQVQNPGWKNDYGDGVAITKNGNNVKGLGIAIKSGVTVSNLVFKPMIRLASDTDSTYAQYTPESLSVSWQDTAGTVYGGSLVVNEDGSGVLTAEYADVDLGELDYTYADNYKIFITNLSGVKPIDAARVPNMISSMYKATSWGAGATDATKDGIVCILPDYNQLRLRNLGYTDPVTFKTAMSGVQLVYELATPLTYTFINLTQLTTLLGTNNIWVDTGDVSVEYYTPSGKIYPTSGTHDGIECYAYKQDGLTYDNYDTSAVARVAVHPVGEDEVAYYYPTNVTSGNTLNITNNALLYGASSTDMLSIAQSIYTTMTAFGTYRPMTVDMFPNECPFKPGDIVPVTDAQGVSFTTAIMEKTVTDSAVTLTSTGREVYGDYALDTAKQLVQLAADIVRINKLKVSWAEIDQAVVGVLTSEGIMDEIDGANKEEQLIYKTVPSGTSSVSPTTTWITNTADQPNTWTKKRPSYDANYPVLFVATQRKAVDGTITCTTPLKDDNSTTISGGQITTGTIDASVVNVIKINADNITTGALKVYDANNNLLFEADKSVKRVFLGGFEVIDGALYSDRSGNIPAIMIDSKGIAFNSGEDFEQSISGDTSGNLVFILSSGFEYGVSYDRNVIVRFYDNQGIAHNYPIAHFSDTDGVQFVFTGGETKVEKFTQIGASSAISIANPSGWRTALKTLMYYTGQAVNATSGTIMRIPASGTLSEITTDTVVLECTFAAQGNIISDVTWTSYNGYIIFSGTCTAATTANVVLGNKSN